MKDMRHRLVMGLALTLALGYLAFVPVAHADPPPPASGSADDSALGRLRRIGGAAGFDPQQTSETTLATIVGRIINTAMSLLGVIFVAQMVYAGYLWMTARDEADQLEKAKHIIRRSIIGLAIVLSAWAIAAFVIIRLSEAAAV